MALTDLFYRCPECGHDPMTGEADRATCPVCSIVIERTGDALVLTRPDIDTSHEVDVSKLVNNIDIHGGPLTRATQEDGSIRYAADALTCWRIAEQPVWFKKRLRGFSEAMGEATPTRVTVDDEGIEVEGSDGPLGRWSYLEIRALQTSSSSLQLSLPDDRLIQFAFINDSPKRWEDLLRHLIREAYRRANKGFVVEFQPRIATR